MRKTLFSILSLLFFGVICCGVLSAAEADSERSIDRSGDDNSADVPTANDGVPAQKEESANGKEDGGKFRIEAGHDTDNTPQGFYFGSYGRVPVGTDFKGHPGYSSNVVHHGPRLMEGPYAELDFGYRMVKDDGFNVKILSTLALMEGLFHYTGESDQIIAVRNLYAEASGFLPYVSVWVGSRMWRGDDIYLLDYWPLDNLNTYGGGVTVDYSAFQLRFHMGVNRIVDGYQYQEVEVTGRSMWAETIKGLDRQRLFTTLKGTYHLFNIVRDFSMKFSLYGEYHFLPSGVYKLEDRSTRDMPQDHGFLVGGQIGMWGFGKNTHLNLFFKYAKGLAAYGEWSVPWGLADDYKSWKAQEIVTALSFNWESRWVAVTSGGYLRRFSDADGNDYDNDDFWEGIITVRPTIFVHDHFQQAFEFSYQMRNPDGLEPLSNVHETPQVIQASVLEILAWDRAVFERPHLRLIYTLSYMNDHALNIYPSGDTRRGGNLHHFLGVGAEWWFNSSYK